MKNVKKCLENVLAAKRLIQNVHRLPKNLVEELRSALKTEDEVIPPKTGTPVAS